MMDVPVSSCSRAGEKVGSGFGPDVSDAQPFPNCKRKCVLPALRVPGMDTTFLLMARYNGRAIIPIEEVCRDYFSHLTKEKFLRKHAAGEIKLPLVRIEESQKSAKAQESPHFWSTTNR